MPLKKKHLMTANKRARGRPSFVPTEEQRTSVQLMAGYKIPHEEICLLVLNGKDKKPISLNTLKKHFEQELATGFANAKLSVMAATFRNAIGDKDHPGNVTAQIWLGKTMFGMRETVAVEAPPPESAEENMLDSARRVAFTLAMGAGIVNRTAPQPDKKGTKQPA